MKNIETARIWRINMPETIRLARPYIQVKRKQVGTLTCGGDQNFFAGAREGSIDFRKQKLGCGITALSDVFLYLAKREGIYYSRETEGYVKSCLTEDEYRDYYNRIYRFVGGIAPWAKNGLSFLRIQGSFNRMARRQKWKLRARWGFSFPKMRGRIEEMLHHDLPVILCIPFMVFKRDKGQGILFYEKRDGKYQKSCKVSAHYVVILGITEQEGQSWLQISSWGKEYYINWEEYSALLCPALKGHLVYGTFRRVLETILGNILYIT